MSANCWPSESCVPFSSSVPCLPSPPAHPPAPVACFLFKYFELHFWEGWVEQMLSNWQCLKFWELLPPKLASKENHECWNFDQDQKLPPLRQSLWKSPLNLKDTAILCQVAILSLETLLPGLNSEQVSMPWSWSTSVLRRAAASSKAAPPSTRSSNSLWSAANLSQYYFAQLLLNIYFTRFEIDTFAKLHFANIIQSRLEVLQGQPGMLWDVYVNWCWFHCVRMYSIHCILVVVDHLWPFTSFGAVLCICLKQITTRELNWASWCLHILLRSSACRTRV